jgi:hypothetical protein
MPDLPRPDLDQLAWTPDKRGESLGVVFTHAVALAHGAEDWYAARRRAKRWGGRALRIGAIVLGAVAAILPVLAEIEGDGGNRIPPGWATIVLAAAAMLVALDRFLGFTAGWLRYMSTELAITRLRHDFEYEWQERLVTLASEPSHEETLALIQLARTLVLSVDDAISAETGTWAVEFRSQLDAADGDLTSARKRGAS